MRAEAAGDAAAAALAPTIEARHFEAALASVRPSVSEREARGYVRLRDRLRAARGAVRGAWGDAGGGDATGDADSPLPA